MGIREVAKMASVSTATVSRVITGSARPGGHQAHTRTAVERDVVH
jgi:DNA-binding LacI/PurR family transcriptional regulator